MLIFTKRLFGGLLLACLLLVHSQPASAQTVKYFWSIELDQAHAFLCSHPVDPAQTKKVRCVRVTYDKAGKITLIEYLSAGRLFNDNGTGVAMIKVEYTESGYEKRSYRNIFGRPMSNNGGYYYERFKMDKDSHKGSLFLYDEFGNPTEDETGCARYLWDLNDNGFIIKEAKLDAEGTHIANNAGVFEERYKLDDLNRIVEERYFGKDAQLIANDHGVAMKKLKWNNAHDVIEAENFGPDELPLGRGSVAKLEIDWDSHDMRTATRFFDANGKLIHITKFIYDDRGNQTERQQYDAEGVLSKDGVARTTYEFDASNHILHLSTLNSDGKLMDDDDSTSEEYFTYDAKGNLIEKGYKNAAGKLALDRSDGFAVKRMAYDELGHSIEDRYFNADNQLMTIQAGYAITRRKFNAHEDQTESAYFDSLDHPLELAPSGIHRLVWTYDDDGKTTDITYYDASGKVIKPGSDSSRERLSQAAGSVSGATSFLKSNDGVYVFKYNSNVWDRSKEQISDKADYALVHSSGNGFGLIFHSQSDDSPADVLKAVLSDLESSMTDVSLMRKEYKTVNNHDALFSQVQGTLKDVTYIYLQYIFKTKTGHVIVMCATPKKTFSLMEADMTAFLNGMQISE